MLEKIVIRLLIKCEGKLLSPLAIAVSSAVYGFCSDLEASVIERLIASLVVIRPRLSWVDIPIPTTFLLSDELVATRMPWVAFAISAMSSIRDSIITGIRSSHGDIING